VKKLHPDFAGARLRRRVALAYHARPLPTATSRRWGYRSTSFRSERDPGPFAGKTAVILIERSHRERDWEPLKAAFESIEGPFDVTRPDHAGRGGRWLIFVGRGYGSTLKK
jgi:hypothetical protein